MLKTLNENEYSHHYFQVLEDARKKFPEYEFLGDPSIAKTAATHRRYTPLSLTGLLVDLHMLSMCDYIVCTFSSQVSVIRADNDIYLS